MSNFNHVEQISVTVTLADGEQHTLTAHRPGPQGDNPHFIGQQIAAGMDGIGERLHSLAAIYCSQIQHGTSTAEAIRAAKGMGDAIRAAFPNAR